MYNLKSPCKDCPFRTDKEGFLTRGRAEEIVKGITLYQGHFWCHKYTDHEQVDDEEDGEDSIYRPGDKDQMCAGSMIMLEHMEKPNQMMRIAERLGMYDRTELDMDAPVFKESDEFIDHHG